MINYHNTETTMSLPSLSAIETEYGRLQEEYHWLIDSVRNLKFHYNDNVPFVKRIEFNSYIREYAADKKRLVDTVDAVVPISRHGIERRMFNYQLSYGLHGPMSDKFYKLLFLG